MSRSEIHEAFGFYDTKKKFEENSEKSQKENYVFFSIKWKNKEKQKKIKKIFKKD